MVNNKQITDSNSALSKILRYSIRPQLFELGELRFWNDSHISRSMLEAHLNPDNDMASRKPETIDKIIKHLVSTNILKKGYEALDLGCGPGLYASKLCENGMMVTGVDISERSIDYAKTFAKERGFSIDYQCMDFLNISYSSRFDVVLQIYGELNTFSNENRDKLLAKIHKALKNDGLFIFDVTTRALRKKVGLKNNWYVSNGGFWRSRRHIVLEQGFDYPGYSVWLDQYIVIDDNYNISIYRNWFHDYSLRSIKQVLNKAGFEIVNRWNDLTGSPYSRGGDWIAILATKK